MIDNVAFGILIGFIFMSLIVLFCAIIIKLYVQKIKNYNQIIYQKDIDFQKAINQTIIETQELVLQNISQELHDDAGQQLTFINFQLENLKLDSQVFSENLVPISQSVTQLSRSIRNMSHSLNNQLLSKQNLVKAIETEVNRMNENSSLLFEFVLHEPIKKSFTTNEKIVIYRIFQEIINNVIKHAHATRVIIAVKTNPNFEMIISDDGEGFDNEDANQNSLTVGLQTITNRAAILNYDLKIASVLKHGTTITLSEKNS